MKTWMTPLLAAALACAALAAFPGPGACGTVQDEGVRTRLSMDAYAGSASCAACHEREHGLWATSVKATFVNFAKDLGAIPGKWNNAPVARDAVFLVVGKRRSLAFADASWTVFGSQYNLIKGRWKAKPEWAGQDYRVRCGPCHLTGSNPWTGEFKEPGVGCEACHGPGAAHAQSQAAADIQVPGKTSGGTVLETCRQCHNQRNRHAQAIEGFSGPYHK